MQQYVKELCEGELERVKKDLERSATNKKDLQGRLLEAEKEYAEACRRVTALQLELGQIDPMALMAPILRASLPAQALGGCKEAYNHGVCTLEGRPYASCAAAYAAAALMCKGGASWQQ